MRELTPDTITDAVLEQMATTPDPRMKEVMAAAVRHLHAFARDVNLTPGEWIKGIEFMTLVGKMCTPARQEFILLSDTLGLSALEDQQLGGLVMWVPGSLPYLVAGLAVVRAWLSPARKHRTRPTFQSGH